MFSLSWCLIWACFCCYKQHKATKPLLVPNRLITNHMHSFLSNVFFNVIVSCIFYFVYHQSQGEGKGTFIVEGSIDIARIMWFEHVSCWSFWQISLIRQKKEDTLLFISFIFLVKKQDALPISHDVFICTNQGALLMKGKILGSLFWYLFSLYTSLKRGRKEAWHVYVGNLEVRKRWKMLRPQFLSQFAYFDTWQLILIFVFFM